MSDIVPSAARRKIAAALYAAGAPLDAIKLDLNTNPVSPNLDLALADMTPATFDGYAQGSPDWTAVLNNPDGSVTATGGQIAFIATGGTVTETLYGWYLHSVGSGLVRYVQFDNPITIAKTGDGVLVDAEFTYSGT